MNKKRFFLKTKTGYHSRSIAKNEKKKKVIKKIERYANNEKVELK